MAMYSKGLSIRDIEDHLRDIYGVEASATLISRITDRIMPELKDILGIWISENESASFWTVVFNELKNRGGM